MKTTERHRLKQNDFAATAARLSQAVAENGRRTMRIAVAVIAVLLIAGGFAYWRKYQADKAGELLGIAVATSEAQIAPASTLPGAAQRTDTFPTPTARGEAAVKAFDAVIAAYPSTEAAQIATYRKAAELLALGRTADAEAAFRKVTEDAGAQSLYGSMARLGLAESLASARKYDEAIKILTDLSAERDSSVPVDGVLVQLARTNVKAGKTADARAAFKRVADEFPESPFAQEAQQQVAALN